MRGFDSMGEMLRWHRDNLDEYMTLYEKYSNVKSIFSSMKRVMTDTLSFRKKITHHVELAFIALYHNIRKLAYDQVR